MGQRDEVRADPLAAIRDDLMTIGRVDGPVVVVRSILLPRADPPPA